MDKNDRTKLLKNFRDLQIYFEVANELVPLDDGTIAMIGQHYESTPMMAKRISAYDRELGSALIELDGVMGKLRELARKRLEG